jgi:hypothetical protein
VKVPTWVWVLAGLVLLVLLLTLLGVDISVDA